MALAISGFLPRLRIFEEAGIMYETRFVRELIQRGVDPSPIYTGSPIIADLSKASKTSSDQVTPENHFDPDDDAYLRFVRSLDPKNSKDQDHYKVLGLGKLRWKATKGQIKSAYRQKSLKHHPDKRQNVGANDYFVCITSAYNQLYMKEEDRRAFDSMDPTFDDSVPKQSEISGNKFFKVLHRLFEENSRFSKKLPVPTLGDLGSTREYVEEFYEFWFGFESWRDFAYADEEDKERGEDRWERRQIDKQNKVEREKKRKEEVKRVRGLVDLAYNADPRIQKFKDEDREKKLQEKEAKRLLIQKKKEDERLAQEEEERKRKEQEELEKQKLAEEKKQKERARKILMQARRGFRQTVERAQYWAAHCHVKQMRCMEEVERICLAANKAILDDLASKLSEIQIYDEAMVLMNASCKKDENNNILPTALAKEPVAAKIVPWTAEENQLLIKATNVFPAGSVERWNQIAAYINEHSSDKAKAVRTDRDVIKQSKAVQHMEFKPLTNQNQLGTGVVLPDGAAEAKTEDAWTPAQQKLLEEGLKKFPGSDPERWDKIAAHVHGKSKKDVVRRYKKLVQLIKEKKGAS
ncbi:hypothetical protein L596_013836 [Steinernema carpocapsae]|uniref:DnaJ homolog subfamily C member 2 n=1 Tax=Steinernema carpocapsae TaxID=34508 RepID=A0A4U5P1C7_STECR|nr:hypothetical protein L596_013836 [Steinernema carpocapsae]